MKLIEIDNSLPNGFHDSYIHSIQLDYEKRKAIFKINIWIGDLSSDIEDIREVYRAGELVISDMIFFVIDPPDSSYKYFDGTPLWVDGGPMESIEKSPLVPLPKDLPIGSFTYLFYVRNWNASFYIAGMEAELIWDNKDTQQSNPLDPRTAGR